MTDQQGDPGVPEPPGTDPTASRSGTPDGDAGRSSFDAAFEGEGWEGRRRRRSSSSSRSSDPSGSSGSAESSEPASEPVPASADRGSSRRRSSDHRSSRHRSSETSAPEGSSERESSSGRSSERGRGARGSRRARHVRSVVLHVVLGLLGLGLAWIVVTGLLAAYQLNQAKSDLAALRTQITSGSGDVDTTANAFATHAHHAAVLTRGPAWATLAAIPYVGDPVTAVRGIATQTSALADGALPGVLAAAEDVNPRTVVKAGAVDLAAVQRASGPVHTAAVAVDRANAAVANLPSSTWLPFVDSATADLGSRLSSLGSTLGTTDQALQVLPSMLGGDGRTRRYFVAFQNNAELRGTGGLPGAFAIVSATNGKISFERFESDSVLAGDIPSGQEFGKAFDTHYQGDLVYNQYSNSNLSPHFPYAAQIWCGMWHNLTGETLDGAVTVDPSALSYLLAVTGPATAPDGQKVSAGNVVELLQKDAYAKFPEAGETNDRKEYILGIAEAVEKKVVGGAGSGRALLEGLARGVSERRILAWSSDKPTQAVLASAPIGGTVPTTTEPYSFMWVNNGGGGKLDYYLDRKVSVVRSGCGDTRSVTVTISLTNNAPKSGLSPYVTGRPDHPDYPVEVGQVRSVVDYAATTGAQLLGVTLDGQTSGASVYDEEGHPAFQTILEIKPGQTRTWVLDLQEPAGTQPLKVVTQPGVVPVAVDVDDRSCR